MEVFMWKHINNVIECNRQIMMKQNKTSFGGKVLNLCLSQGFLNIYPARYIWKKVLVHVYVCLCVCVWSTEAQ